MVADIAPLLGLEPPELEYLSANESVYTKVQQYMQNVANDVYRSSEQHQVANAHHTATVTNLEIQVQRLETSLEARSAQHEHEVKVLRADVSDKIVKIESLTEELDAKKAELADFSSAQQEVASLLAERDVLKAEKRSLMDRLIQRDEERDTLTAERAQTHEATKQLQTQISKGNVDLSAAHAQLVSVKFEKSRMESDAAQLKLSLEWTAKQLSDVTADLTAQRDTAKVEVVKLTGDVQGMQTELLRRQQAIADLNTRQQELQDALEAKINEAKASTDQHATQVGQLQSELQRQKRLSELHNEKENEAVNRTEQLTNQNRALRSQLATAETRAEECAQQLTNEKKATDERVKGLVQEVQDLKAELKAANEIVAELRKDGPGEDTLNEAIVREFAPSALAAKYLTGKNKLSVTGMYTRMVSLEEQLEDVKAENKALSAYMNDIVGDINEEAPKIASMKANYDNAIKMSTETANKLRSAIAKENSLTKETEYLKKELVGARRSQKDVLRQNVTLLKEIDRLRGRPSYNMQVPDVNDTSAQTMITTELVDVRNYEDVVAINAKQTIALRAVTEDNERLNELNETLGGSLDSNDQSLVTKQALAKQNQVHEAQLQEAAATRHQLIEKLQALQKLSYKYKQQAEERQLQLQSLGAETRDSLNNAVSNELSVLREDKQRLMQESELAQAHAKEAKMMAQREIDDVKARVNELVTRNALQASEIGHLNERLALTTSNLDVSTRELNAITQRLTEKATELGVTEYKLQIAEQEVATQKGQISKLEHTRTTLEANVRQLTVQHEAMQRERDTHSTSEYRMKELFDSMQMTLNDHQHARQVDITRMTAQIEDLQNDKAALEDKLRTQRESQFLQVEVHRKALSSIQEEVNSKSTLMLKLEAELSAAVNKRTATEKELHDVKERLTTSEERVSTLLAAHATASDTDQEALIADLRTKLERTQADLSTLEHRHEAAKGHVEEYKALAQMAEEKLDMIQSETETKLASQTKKMEEMSQALAEAKAKKVEVESKAMRHVTDMAELHEKLDRLTADKELSEKGLQAEIQEMTLRFNTARAEDEALRQDLERQCALTAAAQTKYETEVNNHGQTINGMKTVKQNLITAEKALHAAIVERDSISAKYEHLKTEWQSAKLELEEQKLSMEGKVGALERQNTLLHEQVETLGRARQTREGAHSDLSATGALGAEAEPATEDSNTLEGMREIVRYVRRETDMMSIRYENLTSEHNSVKEQLKRAQDQCDVLKGLVDTEKSRHADYTSAMQTHKQLQQKVAEMNVLKETCVRLKAEKETMEIQHAAVCGQLKTLEDSAVRISGQLEEERTKANNLNVEKISAVNECNRWKTRFEQFMDKYKDFDPSKLIEVTEEKDALKSKAETLQTQLNSLTTRVTEAQTAQRTAEANYEQAKAKIDTVNAEMAKLVAEKQTSDAHHSTQFTKLTNISNSAETRSQQILAQMNTTKKQLEDEKKRNEAIDKELADVNRQLAVAKADTGPRGKLQELVQQRGSQIIELQNRIDELLREKTGFVQKYNGLIRRLKEKDATIAAAQSAAKAAPAPTPSINRSNSVNKTPAIPKNTPAAVQSGAGASKQAPAQATGQTTTPAQVTGPTTTPAQVTVPVSAPVSAPAPAPAQTRPVPTKPTPALPVVPTKSAPVPPSTTEKDRNAPETTTGTPVDPSTTSAQDSTGAGANPTIEGQISPETNTGAETGARRDSLLDSNVDMPTFGVPKVKHAAGTATNMDTSSDLTAKTGGETHPPAHTSTQTEPQANTATRLGADTSAHSRLPTDTAAKGSAVTETGAQTGEKTLDSVGTTADAADNADGEDFMDDNEPPPAVYADVGGDSVGTDKEGMDKSSESGMAEEGEIDTQADAATETQTPSVSKIESNVQPEVLSSPRVPPRTQKKPPQAQSFAGFGSSSTPPQSQQSVQQQHAPPAPIPTTLAKPIVKSSSSSQATPSPFGGAFSSTTAPNAFTNANANTTASAPVQFGGSAAFGGAKNAFGSTTSAFGGAFGSASAFGTQTTKAPTATSTTAAPTQTQPETTAPATGDSANKRMISLNNDNNTTTTPSRIISLNRQKDPRMPPTPPNTSASTTTSTPAPEKQGLNAPVAAQKSQSANTGAAQSKPQPSPAKVVMTKEEKAKLLQQRMEAIKTKTAAPASSGATTVKIIGLGSSALAQAAAAAAIQSPGGVKRGVTGPASTTPAQQKLKRSRESAEQGAAEEEHPTVPMNRGKAKRSSTLGLRGARGAGGLYKRGRGRGSDPGGKRPSTDGNNQ